MTRMLIFAALLIGLAGAAFADDSIINVDMSKANVDTHVSQVGSFNGVLPACCKADFPAWNKSVATSTVVNDGANSFLRFDVAQLDQAVLIRFYQGPIPVPGYYMVETICRSTLSPLNVHLRQLEAPYQSFWSRDIDCKGKKWMDDRAYFYLGPSVQQGSAPPPDMSNVRLFLSLRPGETDIQSIKLVAVSRDQVAASMPRPAPDLPNFFRNSRFPLGLQSGWNIDRNNLDGKVESDAANRGPSGSPSLKIVSQTGIRVCSEPFQTSNPNIANQISFACKGSGTWAIRLLGCHKRESYSEAALQVSSTWTTQRISFSPDSLDRGYSIIFIGTGTIYIDSLMAYAGTDKRDYKSADECEIALAPIDSEISTTRIQFSDEPARIKFCATGSISNALLKTRVTDVYGDEKPLPDIKLNASAARNYQFGVVSYDAFTTAQLGQFRIEAWAERDGKRISPINELVMTRIRRPIYWGKDAPGSPFGDHFMSNARTVTTMKAAGINWNRFNDTAMDCTCWGFIEPEKGKWVFRDDKIANYRNGHIKLLGYLGTAPTWASTYAGGHLPAFFDLCYQPKNLDDFSNYVRTVTTRYKGIIDEYEIGNEPWGVYTWHKSANPATGTMDPGPTPAADFAALSKAAYESAKAVDASIQLDGFCTSPGHTSWTKGVFVAGGYGSCDKVSYHYYTHTPTGFPGDGADKAYDLALGYIVKSAPAPLKPVEMTEGNPTRNEDLADPENGAADFTGMYNYSVPWRSHDNLMELSDAPSRFVLSHLALGVKRVYLYSDHTYSNIVTPPTYTNLLGADGYPHPALAAFSNMAWLLEDRKFVKCVPVADNVWAYLFDGRHGSVAAICGPRFGRCTIAAATGVHFLDLFGNPIRESANYAGILLYATSNLSAAELQKRLISRQ